MYLSCVSHHQLQLPCSFCLQQVCWSFLYPCPYPGLGPLWLSTGFDCCQLPGELQAVSAPPELTQNLEPPQLELLWARMDRLALLRPPQCHLEYMIKAAFDLLLTSLIAYFGLPCQRGQSIITFVIELRVLSEEICFVESCLMQHHRYYCAAMYTAVQILLYKLLVPPKGLVSCSTSCSQTDHCLFWYHRAHKGSGKTRPVAC